MNADAEAEAALFRHLVIHRADSFLNAEGAVERIDGARELGQDAVARGIGDTAALLRDEAIRHLPMGAEQAQRAGLIAVHQAGVAGHIGAEDGRETALDDGGRLVHRLQGPSVTSPGHRPRRKARAFQAITTGETAAIDAWENRARRQLP